MALSWRPQVVAASPVRPIRARVSARRSTARIAPTARSTARPEGEAQARSCRGTLEVVQRLTGELHLRRLELTRAASNPVRQFWFTAHLLFGPIVEE
jgi:hypothetical protein